MEIPVTVVGQKMFLDTGQHKMAPRSQKFIKFVFDLSDDWSDMTVFAQWKQGENAYNSYLDSEKSAVLPSEIVQGNCTMMLYGTGGNGLIGTTLPVCLYIDKDIFVADGQSTVITQSLYDQLVAQVQSLEIATMAETRSYLHILESS